MLPLAVPFKKSMAENPGSRTFTADHFPAMAMFCFVFLGSLTILISVVRRALTNQKQTSFFDQSEAKPIVT